MVVEFQHSQNALFNEKIMRGNLVSVTLMNQTEITSNHFHGQVGTGSLSGELVTQMAEHRLFYFRKGKSYKYLCRDLFILEFQVYGLVLIKIISSSKHFLKPFQSFENYFILLSILTTPILSTCL